MEDIAVIGIVINSMPYKEKDKLIHIFTVELGKITATLKGVSSPKAKLKFAGQPFCFGKFELSPSGEFYVVKGVELIDSFYDLTADYAKFSLASLMLEACSIILKPNIISESLFICLIKSLQNLVYNGLNEYIIVLKFLITIFELIGYGLNFNVCDNCGMRFMGDIKFDRESGTFRCSACSGGIKISARDFMNIKLISTTDYDKLSTLKLQNDSIKTGIKLMIQNLSHKLNVKFKSIDVELL
ncbi:MAG: DNA repair protein RecO [Clostridia bacterium]|nr:DNA repair protein RecO [Clostridia bacterium]